MHLYFKMYAWAKKQTYSVHLSMHISSCFENATSTEKIPVNPARAKIAKKERKR